MGIPASCCRHCLQARWKIRKKHFRRPTDVGRPSGELFARSSTGKDKGLFARLSTCNFKDSVYQLSKGGSGAADRGSGPVTSIEQLWQRIATSGRALTGVKDFHAAGLLVKLLLFPWKNEIVSQREYRVFCPPPNGAVSAVSQYSWFKPWMHFRTGNEGSLKMRQTAQNVLHGIFGVHERLMSHSEIDGSNERDWLYLRCDKASRWIGGTLGAEQLRCYEWLRLTGFTVRRRCMLLTVCCSRGSGGRVSGLICSMRQSYVLQCSPRHGKEVSENSHKK